MLPTTHTVGTFVAMSVTTFIVFGLLPGGFEMTEALVVAPLLAAVVMAVSRLGSVGLIRSVAPWSR